MPSSYKVTNRAIEPVPVKFMFARKVHADEFAQELQNLQLKHTLGRTPYREYRWVVTTTIDCLRAGVALELFLREAQDRWNPASVTVA